VEVALLKANWREREKCAYKENCMNLACSSLHTFEREREGERERERKEKKKGLCGCKIVGELAF
jgi:hypothetical protein